MSGTLANKEANGTRKEEEEEEEEDDGEDE